MEFLTSAELKLNKGGYLVANINGKDKPITHEGFVKEQKSAEYLVKLSEAIKDKNFKAGEVADLAAIKAEVLNAINSKNTVEYVKEPKKPTSKANDEIVKFALDFVKYEEDKSKVKKVNSILQEFNTINDVENVGEYFSEGLVKLNKIYSIKEIIEAATIYVDKNI